MSNLFKNLKKYETSWSIVSIDTFDAEDVSMIKYAEVVKSTYGTSLKLSIVGGSVYIPIDPRDETYSIGDSVDVSRVRIKTLHKDGEEDIQRVCFAEKKESTPSF